MQSARDELQRRELNADNFQSLDSHLERLKLDVESMHSKTLELRVKAAILSNRIVRLDNPIIMAKMDNLAEQLEQLMRQPQNEA